MVVIQSTSSTSSTAWQNVNRSASGFANIANTFENIWDSKITDSKIGHALQKIKPTLWNKNPGYTFKIINSSIIGIEEFRLQINPQSIKQSEPFSIKIIPTQTGVVTENEGFIFKDLVISGTTGIFPRRGTAGVTDSGFEYLTGAKSGYQEFLELRNFMRTYAELKTLPENKGARLVFKNYKDNEFWFVEPLKFDGNRSKDKPFCYDYEIVFKIIAKADAGDLARGGLLGELDKFFANVDKIYGTIDASITVFNSAVDFLVTVEQAIETVVLKPLQMARTVIGSISAGLTTVSSLPKQFYVSLNSEIKRVSDNVNDFLGLGDNGYDTIYNRKNTLEYSGIADPLTPENIALLEALVDAEQALNQFIATGTWFDDSIANVSIDNEIINEDSILTTEQIKERQITSRQNIEAIFDNEVSFPSPNSAKEVQTNFGDTLERIALRYLGDASRWPELVSLNKLKFPYLAETADDGVLEFGDKILIPDEAKLTNKFKYILKGKESPITKKITDLEKSLGVDLMINSSFDLVLNNKNDLEVVYGYDNVYQSLYLKLSMEKGSLLNHPELGLNLAIGEKNVLMLDELYSSIRETILSDPRFADVTFIELKRTDNKIELSLKIVLTSPNIEVPFTFIF